MSETRKFYYSSTEPIFGRAGLYLRKEHLMPQDYIDGMKEVEELYKQKYGYECVRVVRNQNDPLMCDVWVIPNNAIKIMWY